MERVTGRLAGHPASWLAAGDGPATVLVHGMMYSARMWSGLRLPGRVLALDMPGHGRTPPLARPEDMQAVVADMVLALADGPAHLVGHSFAGTAVLRAALTEPSVPRITMIEPPLYGALRDAGRLGGIEDEPWPEMLRQGRVEDATRDFVDRWGQGWDHVPEDARPRVIEQLTLVAASAAAIGAIDSPDQIRIAPPQAAVTLIGGDRSPPVAAAILEALQSRLPGARRVTIPGAAHDLPITHPEALAEALA